MKPVPPLEIDYVIENVIGSAIEQAIKFERARIKGTKPRPRPKAPGYRAILLQDLKARGWGVTPNG